MRRLLLPFALLVVAVACGSSSTGNSSGGSSSGTSGASSSSGSSGSSGSGDASSDGAVDGGDAAAATDAGRTCTDNCFRAITCRKGGCNGPVTSTGCCSCLPDEIDDIACVDSGS